MRTKTKIKHQPKQTKCRRLSVRRCRCCRKPERQFTLGGIRFRNFPRHFDICADCINRH